MSTVNFDGPLCGAETSHTVLWRLPLGTACAVGKCKKIKFCKLLLAVGRFIRTACCMLPYRRHDVCTAAVCTNWY